MNPELTPSRRFVAANMSQAMRLLSQAYGSDAVIVSTRKVEGGVELYGMPASEVPPPKTLLERRRARALRKRQLGASEKLGGTQQHSSEFAQSSATNSRDVLVSIASTGSRAADRGVLEPSLGSTDQYELQDNLGNALKKGEVEPRPVSLAAMYDPPEMLGGVESVAGQSEEDTDAFLDEWDLEDDAARSSQESAFSVPLQSPSLEDSSLERIKQELAELQRRVKRHEGLAEQQRDILLSVENIEAGRELFSMGLTLPVIKAVLAKVERENVSSEADRAAQAMLCFKSLLPLYSLEQIEGGLYTVVAGRKSEQAPLLAKMALRAVVAHGAENVAIVTSNENANYFRRLARLTDFTVHRAAPGELLEAVQALNRYSHIFIDCSTTDLHSPPEQYSAGVLGELRSLNLGHHEVLALHGTADNQWTRGQIDHWRSDATRFCLLSEATETANRGALISLLIEKNLPLAGIVDDELMPDSIKILSRGALMAYLSQNDTQGKQTAVPIVY